MLDKYLFYIFKINVFSLISLIYFLFFLLRSLLMSMLIFTCILPSESFQKGNAPSEVRAKER